MSETDEMKITTWAGCYNESWKGLITDDAFAHPAKFAPGLIKRILAHGIERGWWKRGDLLGDPFGGIAGGGIMAGYAGLNWVGVELEPRFHAMGLKNIQLHAPTWLACGDASFVKLVQGDSRQFAQIVGDVAAVLSSPPYAKSLDSGGADTQHPDGHKRHMHGVKDRYGSSPGQIGSLPPGTVDGAITSPPFVTQETGGGIAKRNGRGTGNVRIGVNCGYQNQGGTAGNIAALKSGDVDAVVSSPPYAVSNMKPTGLGAGKPSRGQGDSAGRNKGDYHHPESPGQIGNLKEGTLSGVATSPPFGGCANHPSLGHPELVNGGKGNFLKLATTGTTIGSEKYGESDGQIGNNSPETYWQAMRAVYTQCLLSLKPGGYMAVVVKNYVKNKEVVPLCDQTLQLLTALGFEPVERIRAMLVKHSTREGLFHTETKTTERKSFFRRLAEKKGSPRIDWEEVLIVRKIATQ